MNVEKKGPWRNRSSYKGKKGRNKYKQGIKQIGNHGKV